MSDQVVAMQRAMLERIAAPGLLETPRIVDAFRSVPRHLFLPSEPLDRVYSGDAIPTHRGADGVPTSSSSEPGVMAVMLEQLKPTPGQHWLEIGAGTGYNAAIIASLTRPRGEVTTIEIQEDVAREAEEHLHVAGFPEVVVRAGDGWLGAADRALFDGVEVTASVDDLSPYWVEQLAPGGVLLVPLRLVHSQLLVCFVKEGDRLTSRSVRGGGFMPLHGIGASRAQWPASLVVKRWSLSLPSDADVPVRVLGSLLESVPRQGAPAPLSYDTYAQLDLVPDVHPVALLERGDDPQSSQRRPLLGILDSAGRGLAVSDGTALLAFGARETEERLRALARSTRSVAVQAVPIGLDVEPGDNLVLDRRHHRFLVRVV